MGSLWDIGSWRWSWRKLYIMFWSSFSLGSVGKYVEAAMIVPAIIYCTHDMDVLYFILLLLIRMQTYIKLFHIACSPQIVRFSDKKGYDLPHLWRVSSPGMAVLFLSFTSWLGGVLGTETTKTIPRPFQGCSNFLLFGTRGLWFWCVNFCLNVLRFDPRHVEDLVCPSGCVKFQSFL